MRLQMVGLASEARSAHPTGNREMPDDLESRIMKLLTGRGPASVKPNELARLCPNNRVGVSGGSEDPPPNQSARAAEIRLFSSRLTIPIC